MIDPSRCSGQGLEHIKEAEALTQRLIDNQDTEPLESAGKAVQILLLNRVGFKKINKG